MPNLHLYLLGSPKVELDDQPIQVDTRKAIALLAYLAVSGENHTRDALAALLWPDYDQRRARAALRRTLSSLKKGIGDSWLMIDRENVALIDCAALVVDATHFQQLLANNSNCENLTQAVALYRDDFMRGFTLRDSPAFDDWQFFQTEHLRRLLAEALEKLVHCHIETRQLDMALAYGRRWLELDLLHEPAHRQLMYLYSWTDQRALSLRQYRDCVRILDQELGVSPLAETTKLYELIQENQLSLDKGNRKADEVSSLNPLSHLPATSFLVGRQTEWESLTQAYAAIQNNGQLIVIEGEAGIGKTYLAEMFLTYVQSQGGRTTNARCYVGEMSLAYGPIVALIRSAIPGEWIDQIPPHCLEEVARLLPELNTTRSETADQPFTSPNNLGEQTRLLDGLCQILFYICQSQVPGVLFIDDLQWADTASLDVLIYLARRLQGRPLAVVMTWRSENIAVDHRLRQLLADTQRNNTAIQITLPRLSRQGVAQFIQRAGLNSNKRQTDHLYQQTNGIPFFLNEYLATLAPNLADIEDTPWIMPGGVRDLLHTRLAEIGQMERQLLTTAAVIGRSFAFDILRIASGRSEEETVEALEKLLNNRLLTELTEQPAKRGPIYSFNHETMRALVYEETSLARRRLLHRRVAEALITPAIRLKPNPLASQIAQHLQQAGQETEAATYYKLAGEYAHRLFANAEALALFRSALALGHPQKARLHELIGDLLILQGEYTAAQSAFETAASLCQPEILPRLEHKLGEVSHRLGIWELAESHFQAALDLVNEEDYGTQARLYADLSRTVHRKGYPEHARKLAQQALELATQANDLRALAQAHNILGILANSQEQTEIALQHLTESLKLAETLRDPAAQVAALNNLSLAMSTANNLEQALALTQAALNLCAKFGDRHREAALHNNLADLFHATNQPEQAMIHLKQAVTIIAEMGEAAGGRQPEIWKLVSW